MDYYCANVIQKPSYVGVYKNEELLSPMEAVEEIKKLQQEVFRLQRELSQKK